MIAQVRFYWHAEHPGHGYIFQAISFKLKPSRRKAYSLDFKILNVHGIFYIIAEGRYFVVVDLIRWIEIQLQPKPPWRSMKWFCTFPSSNPYIFCLKHSGCPVPLSVHYVLLPIGMLINTAFSRKYANKVNGIVLHRNVLVPLVRLIYLLHKHKNSDFRMLFCCN